MTDTASHTQADDGAGRGRAARHPAEIPLPGWKDILVRLAGQFAANRVMLVAAGVTFYGLLALFPALTALVSIYGFVSDPQTVIGHVEVLASVLPPGAIEIVNDQMERIAAQPTDRLSIGFALGLAVALWSTNTGVKALVDAMNVAYGEDEKRGFLRLNVTSFCFTLGAIAFIILSLLLIVVAPVAFSLLGVQDLADAVFRLARWPLLLVIVIAALGLLYRYGPSRSAPKLRWVTPGALVAALAWLVVSILFSWYVANFDTYNETYGSLGAIIAFMVWMWLSAVTIISGALIDAVIEHQTACDSTVGADRPMGKRGARVADTLGGMSAG